MSTSISENILDVSQPVALCIVRPPIPENI